MINSVHVVGRLGQDPEMRFTANGNAVTNFSVATDNGFGDKKETEWFSVVTWNKTAEACAQYLAKGSLVYVEGRMKTRSWEGQDGQKRYRTELIANRVQFLDTKGSREPREDSYGGADDDPDDLPF